MDHFATTLAAYPNPASTGQPVTLTAKVTPVPTGSPLGTVNFYNGSTLLGSGVVGVTGIATLTTSTLPRGIDSLTAVYSGSAFYATSTSSALSITVAALTSTSTALSASTLSPTYEQSVLLTASVAPASTDTARGTVNFYAAGALLGSGALSASGVATLSVNTLPIGADAVTAVYSGSASFATSTSAPLTITVVPIVTATVVSASSLTPAYGQPVALTATVIPASTDTAPGTVSFYTGHTLLGTGALSPGGIATLSTSSLPLGTDLITATYAGSAHYATSTSLPLSVDAQAATTITLAASPTTQLFNNPIMLTAQVSSATAGSQTGMVSFLDGSTLLGTAAIGIGGQAIFTSSSLSDGSHNLSAAYSGDMDFLPSVSSGAPVAITIADLNLALGGDKNKTVVPGAAVTYNFPLSPVVTPTFIYDVTLSASGLPPGATYTFSPATIPAGSGTLPVAFTVQTAANVAMGPAPSNPLQHGLRGRWYALAFGLVLPFAGARAARKRLLAIPGSVALVLFGTISLGLVSGLAGCGAGGLLGGSNQAPTSYTITISATSGALVRTSTVQLNLSR